MSRLHLIQVLVVVAAQVAASAYGGDYRGAAAGWPNYSNGYMAANYPTNSATAPAYFVARPVATSGYAGAQPVGVTYVPVTAAYANAAYFAAYGRSPVTYRPVTVAGYSGGMPVTAGYAPVTANYAPANSYAVTPAGASSAGSEAAAYLGQPTTLNYVPPRVTYRTTYAPVPVYMYRPVTTYQPVTAYQPAVVAPTTCMQASSCMSCQPQRSRCFSWWNPFTWFSHGSCGGCGGPPPTTSYCGTGCGQPYYPGVVPTVPVLPPTVIPAPTTIPATPAPIIRPGTMIIPQAGTTIPPPPTGSAVPGAAIPFGTPTFPGATTFPGTTTVPGARSPADFPPRLTPGTIISPAPGGSFSAPGTTITPLPGNTIPAQPGVTPLMPGTTLPATPAPGSFPTGPSTGFGTGTNYAPTTDPHSAGYPPTNNGASPTQKGSAPAGETPPGPPRNVFGSGYRGGSIAPSAPARNSDGVIRTPELAPALPPSIQTVPDLDAPATPRPLNSAPPLLDPRDKTARLGNRWAVVPAQWPKKEPLAQISQRPVTQMKSYQPAVQPVAVRSPYVNRQPTAADYDDRGWKTAAW